MTEAKRVALRREMVNFMVLAASRNRAAVEKKAADLIQSLQGESASEARGCLLFITGMTYFFANNYPEAENQFRQIFDLKVRDVNLWGIAHLGLGVTNRSAGRLDEAVTHLFSASQLIDKNRHFRMFLGNCYHQLGEIHATINEYNQAITYFNNAIEATKADTTNTSQFRFHMGLGGCYLKMKDYEKSKFHLTTVLEAKDLAPTVIAIVENDLGVLYLETKEYDKAEKLLSSSLAIREANNLNDAACTSMASLAEVYLEQNKVTEALSLLNRCLVLVDKFKTNWKKIEVLRLMAQAHGQNKDFALAVAYYDQHNTLFDEVRGEQERKIFKFKNEQIEKQKKIISDKHEQLAATFKEIKRLKVNRKAVIFSWITIIILVIISEMLLDPLIENYAYNNLLSLLVKVMIALLFKPLDGLYESILWKRTLKTVDS